MIEPEFGRYRIRQGQTVQVNVYSNTATFIVGHFRVIYDDGSEDDFRFQNTASGSARTAVLVTVGGRAARQDGWIIDLYVSQLGGTEPTQRGQLYAEAYVILPGGSTAQITSEIAADYVYSGNPLVLGRNMSPGPTGGQGAIRTVTGANPAAGAEVSEAVPTGAVWELLSFSAVLVTDGTSATRIAHLYADDGTTANRRAILYGNQTGQSLSLTRTHFWSPGNDRSGINVGVVTDTDVLILNITNQMKIGFLLAGYRLRTATSGLQGGDDYAAPIFQVEECVGPNE